MGQGFRPVVVAFAAGPAGVDQITAAAPERAAADIQESGPEAAVRAAGSLRQCSPLGCRRQPRLELDLHRELSGDSTGGLRERAEKNQGEPP